MKNTPPILRLITAAVSLTVFATAAQANSFCAKNFTNTDFPTETIGFFNSFDNIKIFPFAQMATGKSETQCWWVADAVKAKTDVNGTDIIFNDVPAGKTIGRGYYTFTHDVHTPKGETVYATYQRDFLFQFEPPHLALSDNVEIQAFNADDTHLTLDIPFSPFNINDGGGFGYGNNEMGDYKSNYIKLAILLPKSTAPYFDRVPATMFLDSKDGKGSVQVPNIQPGEYKIVDLKHGDKSTGDYTIYLEAVTIDK